MIAGTYSIRGVWKRCQDVPVRSAVLYMMFFMFSSTSLPRHLDLGLFSGMALLTILSIVTGLLIWCLDLRYFGRGVSAYQTLYMAAFVFSVASIAIHGISTFGLQDIAVYGSVIIYFQLAYDSSQSREGSASRLSAVILVSSAVSALMYMGNVLIGGLDATVVNPASAAMFWIPAYAIYLSRWVQGERAAVLGCLSYAALMAVSASRTPFGIAIVLVGLAVMSCFRGVQRAIYVVLLIGLFLAAVSAVFLFEPLRSAFFGGDAAITIGGVALNTSGRALLYATIWESFLGSPWLGHGAGSSSVALQAAGIWITQPHNDYLRLLHDFGIFGTCIWLSAFYFLFRALRRIVKKQSPLESASDSVVAKAAYFSFVALLLAMITDNPLVYPHVMIPYAILFGFALGATRKRLSIYFGRMPSSRVMAT